MCPGEEQEVPHPTYEVRLVLIQRHVLLLKELGVAVEHLVLLVIAFGHIQFPYHPDLDNTRFSVVMHGRSSRLVAPEGVHRSLERIAHNWKWQ